MKSKPTNRLLRTAYPIFVLALGFHPAPAQDLPIRLTAEQAVSAALSDNHTLKISSIEEKAAGSRYRETDAVFLPQAGISYSAMTTDNPLNAFGFRLQQKTIGSADFDPASLNHPGATPDFMTTFDLRQPLVNMDGLYQRKAAYTATEIYRLKSQRTKEQIAFETRKAYMQLQLAYQAQKVTEDALATANALYRYTQDRVHQGLLNKADELNIQVQVRTTESSLAQARSQISNASDYLSVLMGRPPGPVYATDSATADNYQPSGDSVLSEDRADLSAMRKGIEASRLMIRSTKMRSMPRLNAFGSYQLNDSRALGFGAGAYLAGLRLSWDIFNGNSIRNRNATLQLEKNQLTEEYTQYKERSVAELNATRRQLADAGFRINQQQTAVSAAGESFRILKDRYEQGLSGSTDVLLAQTQLSQQRLALAQAVFDRDVTKAYIEFLTASSKK
ncbi:MAG: TolC family protein [Bacteroidetes bacterium]|nr:TolC family protein [Bacteroidota bacterium]